MWVLWLWIKESVKGVFRNLLMNSFATLLALVCFLVLAVSTIFGLNVRYITEAQDDKIPVILYLKDSVTDYITVENKIKTLPGIESYQFVSKEEAYHKFKQTLGDKEDMLTELGFNPLPASFEIKVKNPEDIKRIVKIIDTWGVDENIKYGEEFLNNFISITDRFKLFAISLIVVMAGASGVLIYSSIRMNILNRNKEIEIKNLVGAGFFNIRIPFILEAILLTTVSASLVVLLVYFFYNDAMTFLTKEVPIGTFLSVNEIMESLLPILYSVAIGIALISSFLSTRKYLKRH